MQQSYSSSLVIDELWFDWCEVAFGCATGGGSELGYPASSSRRMLNPCIRRMSHASVQSANDDQAASSSKAK